MVQQTSRGLPYVEAADTVTSYPVTSQELATDLNALIPTGKVFTKTTDASGLVTVTAAEMGMTPVGAVASVLWSATAAQAQFASARVNGGNIQIKCWGASAFTNATFTLLNAVSVTVFVIAW